MTSASSSLGYAEGCTEDGDVALEDSVAATAGGCIWAREGRLGRKTSWRLGGAIASFRTGVQYKASGRWGAEGGGSSV